MALAEQTIGIAFGPGLNTKTDPKMLSGKLVNLTNGIFTQAQQVRKRNGYDAMTMNIVGGGTLSNPTMIKSYKNELLCAATGNYGQAQFTGQRLYSYSESLQAWVDKGKYVSVKVSKKTVVKSSALNAPAAPISLSFLPLANSSSATLGGMTLVAWDIGYANLATSVWMSIIDNETGNVMVQPTQIAIGAGVKAYCHGFAKAIALSSTSFAVFYVAGSDAGPDIDTSSDLCFQIISYTEGSGLTIGSQIVVGSCVAQTSTTAQFPYCYDVVQTSVGAFVATPVVGPSSSALYLYTVSTTGTVSAGTTVQTGSENTVAPVQICLNGPTESATNAWIYWCRSSTLYYAIYPVGLGAAVLAATEIQSGFSPVPFQIAALSTSSTAQEFFVTQMTTPATSMTIGVYYPVTGVGSAFQSGSSVASELLLSGFSIYGRPITFNDTFYLPMVTISQTEMTGFIIDLDDLNPVAKFLPNAAEGLVSYGSDQSATTYAAPTIFAVRYPGFLNTPNVESDTLFSLCAAAMVQLTTVVNQVSAAGGAVVNNAASEYSSSAVILSFDFDHIDAYQSVNLNDTEILNGGFLSEYDGSQIVELGFHTIPDAVSAIVSSSGGSSPVLEYQYWTTVSWTDGVNGYYESAPSPAITVGVNTGSTTSVTLGFAPVILTQKQNVALNIYRSLADGDIGYLVASIQNVTDITDGWQTITDEWATDSELETAEALYTDGGAILDNVAAPPSVILWTNNNRVWCVDSENPETTIEYTKTAAINEGINFSTGDLELQIDSSYGEIRAGSRMDEKTVILKELACGYFYGDGANDAGTGETISTFQFIPSDTGCVNSKSVILYPNGILFKSPKGIYQVSRGIQLTYFGTDVEDYNDQDIQSAVLTGSTNQIRFLTSGGMSLLYDYVMGQWSVFSNHAGLSADVWTPPGGSPSYVYARSSNNSTDAGLIYTEDDESYLDNATAFQLSATLEWIKASSVQGFQRLRRVAMLGDYSGANGHGVQITAYWDWSTTPSSVVPYTFDGSSSVYQYRERLSQQKGDAVQFSIEEITTGASGEYIDFSDLGIELGLKKGLRKLPAAQSVG